MENENEELEEKEEEGVDYIKIINDLKANTVSKEAYEKLKKENKQLAESLINGEKAEKEEKEEIDVKKIEDNLRSKDPRISSLDGFKMALQLRKADLEAGKPDPFVSVNNRTPSQEDYEQAQRRADIYQECIDYADGDAQLFAQELSRRMVDTNFTPKKK